MTKTASVTGLWTNTATWGGSAVPVDNDDVTINSGITVYFDDDHGPHGKNFTTGLHSLIINGTLRFPTANMNSSGLTPTAMNALDGYMLIMGSAISITGTGSLYVGDAATTGNYIARSTAASAGSPCVPTVTIKLLAGASISTTTQHYYGWVPTAPAAHPDYTTIAGTSSTIASAASGQAVCNVATGDGVKFLANQTVTISDANNSETNTVLTIATDAITMNNNLAHTYSSATITTVGTCGCAGAGVWSGLSGSQASGQANVAVSTGNGAMFTKGQSVTIGDSNAQENNIISSISGDTLTMKTNLSNTYAASHGFVGATNYPGGQAVLYLTDDLGLQVGDLVAIGAGMPANTFLAAENTTTNHPITGSASRAVYTVSAYDSGTKKLTLTGNLGVGRLVGDYVARYNRPIAVMKATYENTQGALAGGTMQGVLVYHMRGFSSTGAQFTGCTMDSSANNTAALGGVSLGGKFIDCTITYCSQGGSAAVATNQTPVNNYFQGCAGINNWGGLVDGDLGSVFITCVCENCIGGMANNGSGSTFINCTWRAGEYGLFGYVANINPGGNSNRAIGCAASLNTATAITPNGDISSPKGETRIYNCILSSASPVASYTSSSRAPQETIQSYDHGGVAGARYCWCRGGHGLTGAYTTPYNAYANPMKFVVEVQNTASVTGVLLWDVPFEMPANTTLTISVPMARDTTNIAAELWVINQYNDPLWTDPSWQVTPTQSTSDTSVPSPTTTYVVGRAALTAAVGTWQTVSVTIPSYPYARKLTARVIGANSAAASGNFYADLDTLDRMILKKKRIFL